MVEVKEFSASKNARVERISLGYCVGTEIKHADIKGYVTAKYDGHWWLGCVTQLMPDSNEVEVSFLHPHGPAQTFQFPHPADNLIMSCEDVLTTVDPITATGRTYSLTDEEITAATMTLDRRRK
jgi:hypothetical protein